MVRSPLLERNAQFPVRKTLALIGAIVVAESLLATVLFPFIYFMVCDFQIVHERYIGYWAGLISRSKASRIP